MLRIYPVLIQAVFSSQWPLLKISKIRFFYSLYFHRLTSMWAKHRLTNICILYTDPQLFFMSVWSQLSSHFFVLLPPLPKFLYYPLCIDIIASNTPQMKIKAVSQWTARFNIQRKPEKCWCLLRDLSFGLFDHKKISGLFQNFSKISAKFHDFPGLFRTGGNHELKIKNFHVIVGKKKIVQCKGNAEWKTFFISV